MPDSLVFVSVCYIGFRSDVIGGLFSAVDINETLRPSILSASEKSELALYGVDFIWHDVCVLEQMMYDDGRPIMTWWMIPEVDLIKVAVPSAGHLHHQPSRKEPPTMQQQAVNLNSDWYVAKENVEHVVKLCWHLTV